MGGLIELVVLGGIVAAVVVVLTRVNANRPAVSEPDDTGLLSDLGQRSWSSDTSSRDDPTAMPYDGAPDDPSSMDSDGDGIAESMDTDDSSDSDSSDSSDSGSSDD